MTVNAPGLLLQVEVDVFVIPTGPDTTNYVVQRDGTLVTQRDATQVVDQRP